MKRKVHCALLPFLGLFLCSHASAASVPVQHGRLELIAEKNSLVFNQDVWLGVHFILDKGWHIYWTNPGDSGQPPSFHWQVPQDVKIGEVEWPRPERLVHGPIVDYGYQDQVLFMLPARATPNTRDLPNSTYNIALDARWLICREICIPDHAQLTLTMPLSKSPGQDSTSASLFIAGRKLLPRPAPSGWRFSASSSRENFILTIVAGQPVKSANFFPLEPGQIENDALQIATPTKRGIRITLKKSDFLVKPVASLKGVLVLGEAAYQVNAPISETGTVHR